MKVERDPFFLRFHGRGLSRGEAGNLAAPECWASEGQGRASAPASPPAHGSRSLLSHRSSFGLPPCLHKHKALLACHPQLRPCSRWSALVNHRGEECWGGSCAVLSLSCPCWYKVFSHSGIKNMTPSLSLTADRAQLRPAAPVVLRLKQAQPFTTPVPHLWVQRTTQVETCFLHHSSHVHPSQWDRHRDSRGESFKEDAGFCDLIKTRRRELCAGHRRWVSTSVSPPPLQGLRHSAPWEIRPCS